MPVQRFVDSALAVAKESVKTFTYEAVNNIVRLINGVSALLLVILPGKNSILEGMSDWELRPSFRAPKLPRWMENGVSSFNQFIHDWSVDSDTCSSVDYSSEEEYSDESTPGSPMSHCSHFSTASSFTNSERHWMYWIRYIISWITLPMRFLLGIPFFFCNLFSYQSSNGSSNPKSPRPPNMDPPRRLQSLKEHVIQRATDRRRGVVEDLHVAIEIFIESIFDFFHKAARCLFAPLDTFWVVVGWFYSGSSGPENYASEDSVTTASLSETDPTLSERKTSFYQSHNSDTRTCQDVITELGYPYEAIRVVTSDGYVLLLERIPRRDSRKVVYLQHGVLDSSMGWVSNGVVGSPAFAAYDQGFDVFLGNLRGLVSKEHVVKNISTPEYWKYSINEHGTEDIPAMIEKIHEIKVSELPPSSSQTDVLEESNNDQPYKLCAICHSLGGAAILIYIITRRILEKPHRLSRMILLSPAGFHHDSPFVFTLMEYIVYLFGPLLAAVIPALYIPTRVLRMITNKLARDFHNLPAVGAVVQTMVSYFVGGDSSNWVGVLGLPHYNMNDMPGVSMGVMLHLAQIKRAKRFIMFDHGSPEANMKEYGSPEPLDLGEYYQLIDIPVDLVAGRKDKVIRASMIRKHYNLMKTAGVQVSYNEFEYAHLDFTFSHREELLNYVMSRLLLVSPPSSSSSRNQNTVKYSKLKKRKGVKNDNISEETGVFDDER